jgi:protein-L-isoaspartate(D-aspartate) O-methyltransferase
LNDFRHYEEQPFAGDLTIAGKGANPYAFRSFSPAGNPMLNVELARHNMIEQQVRPWDVLDSRVLGVLSAVPRESFVPEACRNLAFTDICLPLGRGEFMMKPVVEGRMLQAVSLQPGESVLEIGTGSGFVTACLARLGGDVLSVEQHADFADAARARLAAANIANARVETADAVNGFDPGQVFDVMVVTGAVHALPQHWRNWIKLGGRVFCVVGNSPVQRATLYVRSGDAWTEQALFETDLPYLRHAEPPQRFVL